MNEKLRKNESEVLTAEPTEYRLYQAIQNNRITLRDICEHLTGPGMSLVFHLILFASLATMVVSSPASPEKPGLNIIMEVVNITPPDKLPELKHEEDDPLDSPHEIPDVERPTKTDVNTDVPIAETNMVPSLASQENLTVIPREYNKSSLTIPSGAFALRDQSIRQGIMKDYNPTSINTESAVLKALRWLKKVQNEDGTWGDKNDVNRHEMQLTCLALMTFLAYGETTESAEFGDALMRGLERVLAWAQNSSLRHNNGIIMGDYYAHSRIVIVLAEAYAATKIPALGRAMDAMVEPIIRNQNPIGGWGGRQNPETKEWEYYTNLDQGSRIYNALYSAFAAGSTVPGILEAIDRSINAIENHHFTADGGFSFAQLAKKGTGAATFDAAGAGTLYLYMMGEHRSRAAESGLKWLEKYASPGAKKGSELKMDWKKLPASQTPTLGWYYMTQAIFQGTKGKGNIWRKWNASMASTLVREQEKEGYWQAPADKYPLPPQKKMIDGKEVLVPTIINESKDGGFSELNSKIWATVYCTLTLEVYYTYQLGFQLKMTGELISENPGDEFDRLVL